MTTLVVSDKCIPEWLFISSSLQNWVLVYWEAACLVWSPDSGILCHSSSVLLCTRGALESKSPAAWQMYGSNCLSIKTSQ